MKTGPLEYNRAMEQSTYKIGIVQKFRIREFGPIFDVCISNSTLLLYMQLLKLISLLNVAFIKFNLMLKMWLSIFISSSMSFRSGPSEKTVRIYWVHRYTMAVLA